MAILKTILAIALMEKQTLAPKKYGLSGNIICQKNSVETLLSYTVSNCLKCA